MILVVLLGLAAAVFLALGFVLQQRAAAEAPVNDMLSLRILVDLMRRPLWLAGIGSMIVGQLLGAAALRFGELTIVEPLLAANILFALPLAASLRREHLGMREWSGALALAAGLGGFVWAADPQGSEALQLPWPNWAVSTGAIIAIALGLVAVAKRLPFAREATLLAGAAGCLYGLQDALTRKTLNAHGIFAVFTDWPVYLLLAVAVTGLMLAQSAFRAASLAASLPAITIAEPITGIAFGAGVYGEGIRVSGLPLTGEVLSLLLMALGVWLVATSPLVTGADTTAPDRSDDDTTPSEPRVPAGAGSR